MQICKHWLTDWLTEWACSEIRSRVLRSASKCHYAVLFIIKERHSNTLKHPGAYCRTLPISLLWHLTNRRWIYNTCIHKCYSLTIKLKSTIHKVCYWVTVVWLFVQQPRNKITVTRVSLVFMQLSIIMQAASAVIHLWSCWLQWK